MFDGFALCFFCNSMRGSRLSPSDIAGAPSVQNNVGPWRRTPPRQRPRPAPSICPPPSLSLGSHPHHSCSLGGNVAFPGRPLGRSFRNFHRRAPGGAVPSFSAPLSPPLHSRAVSHILTYTSACWFWSAVQNVAWFAAGHNWTAV